MITAGRWGDTRSTVTLIISMFHVERIEVTHRGESSDRRVKFCCGTTSSALLLGYQTFPASAFPGRRRIRDFGCGERTQSALGPLRRTLRVQDPVTVTPNTKDGFEHQHPRNIDQMRETHQNDSHNRQERFCCGTTLAASHDKDVGPGVVPDRPASLGPPRRRLIH